MLEEECRTSEATEWSILKIRNIKSNQLRQINSMLRQFPDILETDYQLAFKDHIPYYLRVIYKQKRISSAKLILSQFGPNAYQGSRPGIGTKQEWLSWLEKTGLCLEIVDDLDMNPGAGDERVMELIEESKRLNRIMQPVSKILHSESFVWLDFSGYDRNEYKDKLDTAVKSMRRVLNGYNKVDLVYRKMDLKALYMEIIQNTPIANNYTPGQLSELLDMLV